MSETIHYKGTLTKVERLENESLEEQCKRLLNGKELDDCYDTYKEMLLNEFYKQYYLYNDILYLVNKIELYGDVFNASNGKNGEINFEIVYYNGGCSFNDAIERALNDIK